MGIIFPVNSNDLTTATDILKVPGQKIVVTTTKIKGKTSAYLSWLN